MSQLRRTGFRPTAHRKRRRAFRTWLRAGAIGSVAVLLAGCGINFSGLNSIDMPGTRGHGPGSYKVFVDMPDLATLPQNSPVLIDDVTVGSVSGVDAVQRQDGSFYAALQISLDPDVKLPANTTARIGQTSLLGSQHVALAAPLDPIGELRGGSRIEIEQSSRFPTTEETLSALGVVVNNGNLGGLQDVTEAAYNAFHGRTDRFVDFVPRLAELTAALDGQTDDIIAAAEGLNRFGMILADNKESLSRALDSLPDALKVLNENRGNIVDAFSALQKLGVVAANILQETKDDFTEDLIDLYPVIKALNDNRGDFVTSLDLLPTFPFSTKYMRRAIRGDFLNVFVTFDLTVRRIGETLFTTSYFDPNMPHMDEVINPPDWLLGSLANLSGQAADPFKIPPGTASGQDIPPEPVPGSEGGS